MKRFISLLLCLVLVFGFALSENSVTAINNTEVIIIEKTNDGDYIEIPGNNTKSNSGVIKLLPAEHDGFFYSDNGQYYGKSGNNKYYQVDREVILLSKPTSLESITYKYDLNPEIIATLKEAISCHDPQMAPNATATLYLSGGNSKDTGYPYADENGNILRDDTVVLTNAYTTYQIIKMGTTAHNVSASLYSIVVQGVSNLPGVGFIASGISLFTDFVNTWGTPTVWYSGDYVQVRYNFDKTSKWTYVKTFGQWVLGAHTNQVKIKKLDSAQYYTVNGTGRLRQTTRTINTTHSTPNFEHPEYVAPYYVYQPISETISYKADTHIFYP